MRSTSVRRPGARIAAATAARLFAIDAGRQIRASRRRRRLTPYALGERVGASRQQVAKIEAGDGAGVPLEVWFALGEALGRPFRAGFMRDRLEQPTDAGHLDIQELVLRLGRQAGYEGRFELATRPADPARSIDAPLLDRRRRRMIVVECWNTFGDLGAAARSSDRKLADAQALAVALAGAGTPFEVGLCWVVRDTAANRALLTRYAHIFASRFPGSSPGWARALPTGGPIPTESGLVW